MDNSNNLSEAKRALLERFLQGDIPKGMSGRRPIEHRTSSETAPLSYGQQQLWLLAQLSPRSSMYNECITVGFKGALDVAALEQSFSEIVRRHEAWRTTFAAVEGKPVQLIHPPGPVPFRLVDLRGLPVNERWPAALRLATEEASRPYDLEKGPLLRVLLVTLADDDHRLFIALHHIIFDGVSVYGVLMPELVALYEALSAGKSSALQEPGLQYSDYALWQREQGSQDAFRPQMEYWRQKLGGDLPTLQLPLDHPRPSAQTFRGAVEWIHFTKEMVDALKEMSRSEGVTLFMTIVASVRTLLYRYSGQEDILLGTVTAGRDRSELERVMGFFLNTVVLRTDLSGDPSFRQLLLREREVALGAYSNDGVPFELVVRELHPDRDISRNPIFQVMLSLEPPLAELDARWSLSQVDLDTGSAKFDIAFELDDRPEGLIGRFEYSTDLFDRGTAVRMLRHWETILRHVLANPGQKISEIPLLSEEEREQLLVEWNATAQPYPADLCIHQLIEAQVERSPEAPAVRFEGEELTYRQLNERANQLAHHLQDLGVGPDVLVGICMERSLELVVGLLGILKAGGAYVPLDPTYPAERLSFMLEDSQAAVLVTQEHLLPELPEHGARVVCLDRDRAELDRRKMDTPVSAVAPHNLAYVIYTSGSTGVPKGVLVTHQNVVHSTHARKLYYVDQPGAFLLLSSISFDSSVVGIYWTLFQGGSLVMLPERSQEDAGLMAACIREQRVTHLLCVPSLYVALLGELDAGPPPALAVAIVAGEDCPEHVVQKHQECMPSTALYNEYGVSEATVWSTVHRCRWPEVSNKVPIGRPIANTEIYLLDGHQQPVPIGVPGELYIGGVGIARGYLNRPELTAERFIPNPFRSGRLYKTGDLARYLPDGTIEFLGRIDEQVKIRGYRIEPGEIESVLARHPSVRECLVEARDDGVEASLVAYLVLDGRSTLISQDFRDYLRYSLPSYMVPAKIVILEQFPLTPNGKIDRRALFELASSPEALSPGFRPPTTGVQRQLALMWEELFDIRPIGLTDDFFDLGGHSLLALRLFSQIEQNFGIKIPLATLFQGATIEHLAEIMETDLTREAEIPLIKLRDGDKRPFFFLHGDVTGAGFYSRKVAQHLNPGQPFYVLQPYGAGGAPMTISIEEMATASLQLLREIQPEGPYVFGGYCNGGIVAFEMARQLHSQGEQVDLLIVLHVGAPTTRRDRLIRNSVMVVGRLARMSPAETVKFYAVLRQLKAHARSLSPLPVRAAWRVVDRVLLSGRAGEERPTLTARVRALRTKLIEGSLQDKMAAMEWAIAGYVPRRYPGKVTLLWGEDAPSNPIDPAMGWSSVAQDVDVRLVPGSHAAIVRDADGLAAILQDCLDEVQESREILEVS